MRSDDVVKHVGGRIVKKLWCWLLARLHLSEAAVCEMSEGLGLVDYHDYCDDEIGTPCHFVELTCKRCGKKFMM